MSDSAVLLNASAATVALLNETACLVMLGLCLILAAVLLKKSGDKKHQLSTGYPPAPCFGIVERTSP
jgi:hypothetical protein